MVFEERNEAKALSEKLAKLNKLGLNSINEANFISKGTRNKLIKLISKYFYVDLPIENYLRVILIGKPKELLKVHNEIKELFPYAFIEPQKNEDNPLYDAVGKIFNYKNFSETKGFVYKLTKKLDINICPYCNREFIFTVSLPDSKNENAETECLIRPELDHYFPQCKYPLLALSFCNLIPAGHICNSNIKHKKELEIGKHIHPYIKGRAKLQFYTDLKSGKTDSFTDEINPPEIVIQYRITKESDDVSNSEEQIVANTFSFFGLQRIYQYHIPVAKRIHKIFMAYPPELINDILNKLKCDASLKYVTKEKMFEILFSEFDIKATDNEILGHLKKDLYCEMHNIYDKIWKEIE